MSITFGTFPIYLTTRKKLVNQDETKKILLQIKYKYVTETDKQKQKKTFKLIQLVHVGIKCSVNETRDATMIRY